MKFIIYTQFDGMLEAQAIKAFLEWQNWPCEIIHDQRVIMRLSSGRDLVGVVEVTEAEYWGGYFKVMNKLTDRGLLLC